MRNGITLLDLLADLKLKPESVVMELNRECVDRKQVSDVELHDGDSLEVIRFVGGG